MVIKYVRGAEYIWGGQQKKFAKVPAPRDIFGQKSLPCPCPQGQMRSFKCQILQFLHANKPFPLL
jgi:hypothetical protein